jgi:BA14K-like protein
MRSWISRALLGSMLAGVSATGLAAGPLAAGSGASAALIGEAGLVAEAVQWRGHRGAAFGGPRYAAPRGFRHGGGRPYAVRPGYRAGPNVVYRRGYRGDGVAAGVAAGALGALVLGGMAVSGAFEPEPAYAPIAPARRQWCMKRYRSYDPVEGTYVGFDGRVRYCG